MKIIYYIFIIAGLAEYCWNRMMCPGLSDSNMTAPVNFFQIKNSTFANVYLYFLNDNPTTNFKISFRSDHIYITGALGRLILDGNVNYVYGENLVRRYYTCNEMRLAYNSFNLYWAGNPADMELIISCSFNNVTTMDIPYKFENTLLLTFPVVNIPAESYGVDTNFLASIVNTLNQTLNITQMGNNSIYGPFPNMNFTAPFTIDGTFLKEDSLNINNQFYFYSSNDVWNCNQQVSWVVFNTFLKIDQVNFDYFSSLFDILGIDNTYEVNEYFNTTYNPKYNRTIFRNFYINNDFEILEDSSLASLNEAQYLKIFSKILFVILVIILYD